jgi:nitroreductase
MPLHDLVVRNRSYRRFVQDQEVSLNTLKQLIATARLAPSAGNAQPLKYVLSVSREQNAIIFPHLGWAAQLKDWPGPAEGERPAAYIIILGAKRLKPAFGYIDQGIVAQTILLAATELGLGGVMIGSVRKDELAAVLKLSSDFEILLALALGKPKEEVVLESLPASGSTSYWRDEQQRHHVPKRALDDLIVQAS